jgi:hypothetical protein
MKIIQWFRNFIKRVRLALLIFRKGLPKEDRKAIKAITDVVSGHRKPGFPCPQCSEAIVINIPDLLLARSTVCCSKCGLKLKMDWQKDNRACQALEKLQEAAAKVEQARRFQA